MDVHKKVISQIMILGVILAEVIVAIGIAIFLFYHWGERPGDHLFHGEPLSLRKPIDIVASAFTRHDQAFIQLGILLLLINPLVRVAAALLSYALNRDVLFTLICSLVLCVLCVSFFI